MPGVAMAWAVSQLTSQFEAEHEETHRTRRIKRKMRVLRPDLMRRAKKRKEKPTRRVKRKPMVGHNQI